MKLKIKSYVKVAARKERPTLAILNRDDKPAKFGGKLLKDDGKGNQLWEFDGRFANRFEDGDGDYFWSDEIEAWGYTSDDVI